MATPLQNLNLTPEEINWQAFGSYTGFRYYLLNVDVERRVIDLLFQFDAGQRCFYHTHHQPSSTLVLQGEQHIWEPQESGPETHTVRPAGGFAVSEGAETHIEGGGTDGCIVYQNIRCAEDPVYSILNDDLTTRVAVSLEDFAQAHRDQSA